MKRILFSALLFCVLTPAFAFAQVWAKFDSSDLMTKSFKTHSTHTWNRFTFTPDAIHTEFHDLTHDTTVGGFTIHMSPSLANCSEGDTLTVTLTRSDSSSQANFYFEIDDDYDNSVDVCLTFVAGQRFLHHTEGIEQTNAVSISTYPNPATNFVTVNSPESEYFDIRSLTGQVIGHGTTNEPTSVAAFPNGMYFITTKHGMQRFAVTH